MLILQLPGRSQQDQYIYLTQQLKYLLADTEEMEIQLKFFQDKLISLLVVYK